MKNNRRPLLGLLLVLIGALILLDNLDIIYGLPYWLFSWVNIFLIIAVFNLISGRGKAAFIFGCIWAFFFLQQFFNLNMGDYWPVILILIGVSFLINRGRNRGSDAALVNDQYFDDLNVFGGSHKKFSSQSFQGGKTTSVFGGSDIDLRGAQLEDGAVIDVFVMFGGVDLIVPEDWNVKVQVTAIFGGFDDKRLNQPAGDDAQTLFVKGIVLFGGGELKSSK